MRLVVQRGAEVDGKLTGSLASWMRREDALRGRVMVERGEANADAMGGDWIQAVSVAAGTGVTASVARVAVAWIKHQKSDVTLKVTASDGREVAFTGSVADVDTFTRRFTELAEFEPTGSADETA